MSRHFSPFTREDEKELFKEDVDQILLGSFRNSYTCGNSAESCSVDVIIDLNHATVDEIESWKPNEALTGTIAASFDRYTMTLKVPDNVRKLAVKVYDVDESSARDSVNSFLAFLASWITDFQLQQIFQENPNKYKCATCQKTPATRDASMLRQGVNDTIWRLHSFPCFPVCDSAKCYLIATNCMEKIVKTLDSVTGE
jgi:hypothetical protein